MSDPAIARKIADFVSEGERTFSSIVEIGPGRGILSEWLSLKTDELLLIEKDSRLISGLRQKFGDNRNIRIVEEDALVYPFESVSAPYAVVSNLPYNISVPLFLRLLGARKPPSFMVLMFQKEVARRLVAKSGTPDYGHLSVVSTFLATITKRMDLLPGAFFPRPKVQSSVVTVRPRTDEPDPDTWVAIALSRQLFLYRRKILSRAFRTAFPDLPPALSSCFSETDQDFMKTRVDDLAPRDFLDIAQKVRLHAPLFFDRMFRMGKEQVTP